MGDIVSDNSINNTLVQSSEQVSETPVEKYRKIVASWLFIVALFVVGMIVLGGLTRLTGSGLSMVEWKLLGMQPPATEMDWIDKFEKYKQFPEYKLENIGMTLEEFKVIFWFEYSHRMLGRTIGLIFALPAVFFFVKKAFPRSLYTRLLILFVLGGLQGLVGWWMVKSGLVDRPDVSHYRLTTHLGLAVFLYIALLWTALTYSRGVSTTKPLPMYSKISGVLLVMAYGTLLSGGLVAGLHAGAQFNTFPLMAGQWIPQGLFIQEPWYMNFTENLMTVQFNHRYFAVTTAICILFFAYSVCTQSINIMQRRAIYAMIAAVCLQISLGISTLLSVVWIPLASLHQLGAIVLISSLVWVHHELWNPSSFDGINK